MNPTRTGKIARLPLDIREQLNRRLQDGQQGKKVVAWLNSLPEVRSIVAAEFGGRPVREQNLSEWRQGGYRDWLAMREAREATSCLADELANCRTEEGTSLSETLSRWLAARYAIASRRIIETPDGPEQWRMLREMCGDVVELRRGDHCARRLDLEHERIAISRHIAAVRQQSQVEAGLDALAREIRECPEALAAFKSLAAILQD